VLASHGCGLPLAPIEGCTDGFAVVVRDLVAILFHRGMQERRRREDDGGPIRHGDGRAVLSNGADVDHVLAVLVDRSAQQSYECMIRAGVR